MSDMPAPAADLERSGMFLQALHALERLPKRQLQDPAVQIARADLLQRVGAGDEARRIAAPYAASRTVPAPVRALANLVLAGEYREAGDNEKAIAHLQKTIALCEACGDDHTKCRAGLALLLATSELPDRAAPGGFLVQLRKDVVRLGDPHVTAALHFVLSQIEMKRGLFESGLHHLRVGRGILATHPNFWLDGIAAVDASCLRYCTSDFEGALREARHGLACGRASGHRGLQRAAFANLGHVYLTSDQLDRADGCLKQALALGRGGPVNVAILEALAHVRLACGDLDGCDHLLSNMTPARLSERRADWYYVFYALVTKVRSLLARGAADEALEVTSALDRHVAGFDPRSGFRQTVQLLAAQALLAVRRPGDAADLACLVADSVDETPLETLPRAGHIIGKLHVAARDASAAGEWFERTARVLGCAADERRRVDVLRDYADLLWPAVRRPGEVSGAVRPSTGSGRTVSPPVAPAGHPAECRVTFHPAQATDLAPARPPLSAASALASAATLVEFAGQPRLAGAELQELLRRCGAITDAAVVSRADDETLEILAFWGDYAALPTLLEAGPGVERIAVGRWRQADIELRARACPSLAARTTLVAARRIVRAALDLEEARSRERERAALWPLDEPVDTRLGLFANQAMLDLVASARKIGASSATVLIVGETGVGKEVVARIIHDASARAGGPFLPFNCAAVPRDMLDSQLFGHRRGAFTSAVTDSPGVIRSAAGGTLLLDEVGEITPDLQPKLLRFLEAGEIQPVGEPHPVRVDVRVLASTNADLERLVAAGRFREDLYYRLNVIRLRVPPLRERREEIPMLVQHFLAQFAAENGKENLRVAEETMEYLLLYGWPGNVRELVNQMRRLAALAENGAVLMPAHLSPEIAATRRTVPPSERALEPTEVVVRIDQPLAAAVEQIERAMLPWAMRAAGGRLDVAARMMGLSRKGLYLKRQRLNVPG